MSPVVYFIRHDEDGLIKIGTSKNLAQRLVQLRAEYRAELTVLGVCDGDIYLERELHKQFISHWRFGEWFKPSEELMEFINQHAKQPSLDHLALPITLPKKISQSTTISFPLKLNAESYDALKALAKEEHRPVADVVRQALEEYAKKKGRKITFTVDRGGNRREKNT